MLEPEDTPEEAALMEALGRLARAQIASGTLDPFRVFRVFNGLALTVLVSNCPAEDFPYAVRNHVAAFDASARSLWARMRPGEPLPSKFQDHGVM